jgi:uncharacterized membrane protein
MKAIAYAVCLAAVVALSACGQSKGDRALSGGMIGAAGGAAAGALIPGVDPVTGAIIGGAVGAAGGALTDEDDLDLGCPIWDRDC